jgi:molecular chaperone DnaK (HSP70)
VLRELKRAAEEHFREQGEFDFEVDRAVITVPAYFNDAQRTATAMPAACRLEVLRIINEPTAASLAYGSTSEPRHDRGYDLGGGTFDISILKVEDGVFQVLATNGDTHLGGDDIDALLTHAAVFGRDPGGFSPQLIQAIRKAVIQAKWISPSSTRPRFASIVAAAAAGYRRASRGRVRALIAPLDRAHARPCRQALADAGLEPKDIDEAVLVGGSTRIPLVRRVSRSSSAAAAHAS